MTITNTNGTSLYLDATSAPVSTDIASQTNVTVCKVDSGTNTVTITDSTPRTVPLDPLVIGGECVHLILSGSVWYRK